MECLWCFLKLWSCRSGSGFGFWGFDWFKNVGLFLVFVLSIMVLQYVLQLSCLIRFATELIGKWCVSVSGVCSKLDLSDFCDEKLWPCGKFLWGLCKISILQLHVIQGSEGLDADSSEFFCDCDAHDGYRYCDLEGRCRDCCYECSCDDDLFWDCNDSDGEMDMDDEDAVFNVVALREMIKSERQRADAAMIELEKERMAVASAAEEAMAMILRLQNEKSLIQIEANNFKKMAEQKMLYDQETIQSFRLLLFEHKSEPRLLEKHLRLCRQKLKLYSHETEVSQFEGMDTAFSDFTMENCHESSNALYHCQNFNHETELDTPFDVCSQRFNLNPLCLPTMNLSL